MIRFNHFNFNVVDLDRSLTFYRDALGQGSRLPQMGQQGLLIVVHPALTPGQGVKITVVALAAAEGDVDIKAQFFRHWRHLVSIAWILIDYYTTKSAV